MDRLALLGAGWGARVPLDGELTSFPDAVRIGVWGSGSRFPVGSGAGVWSGAVRGISVFACAARAVAAGSVLAVGSVPPAGEGTAVAGRVPASESRRSSLAPVVPEGASPCCTAVPPVSAAKARSAADGGSWAGTG
ncbi:hypothetical protein ACFYOH_44105, partial [Streptomyces sp. NPDC007856]